jgi:hypothetical protein
MKSPDECARHLAELHKIIPPCRIPDSRFGDWSIRTVEISPHESAELFELQATLGADQYIAFTPPGQYKFLGYPRFDAVMNDTYAELALHERFVKAVTGKVLITGLGLGLLPTALLMKPGVTRIDIVELEADVIGLVRPHLNDERVFIHHADAFEFDPSGTWDWAWHDLLYWDLTVAQSVMLLKDRYAPFAKQQDAWGEGEPWFK